MADEPQDPQDAPKPDDAKDDLGDAGKKALDAERKARRDAEKQAKELKDKLQAIEDKDKSDVDRLTEQVAALTKERDTATHRADRLEVAVVKSLDEDRAKRITSAAKRLTGSTREELEADADEFLTAFAVPESPAKPAPVGKPREDLKPGNNDPDAPVEEKDLSKIGARMFGN
jgi:hypothetical protein